MTSLAVSSSSTHVRVGLRPAPLPRPQTPPTFADRALLRFGAEQLEPPSVVGEPLDLADEARPAPEPATNLLVAFACGPQPQHASFHRGGDADGSRRPSGYLCPGDDPIDVRRAAVEPTGDLIDGDSLISKGKDATFERAEVGRVRHGMLPGCDELPPNLQISELVCRGNHGSSRRYGVLGSWGRSASVRPLRMRRRVAVAVTSLVVAAPSRTDADRTFSAAWVR